MPIQAQSADGMIHEFPDDTASDVVDRAMADYARQQQPGLGQKISKAVDYLQSWDPLTGFGKTPEQQVAFESGVISGSIPVVGPMIRGGAERIAAGLRSVTGGQSYEEELKAVQQYARRAEKENPLREMVGEVIGGVAGTALVGMSSAGRWALGMAPESTLGKVGAGALSGAVLGGADVAVRGEGDPLTGGAISGVAGAVAPAIAPAVRGLAGW